MYQVRCRLNGNVIEEVGSLEEAKNILVKYEEDDKLEGIYEEEFYEIYDVEQEEIIK